MSFDEKINQIKDSIETSNFKEENKEYLETLLDDLLFRFNCIDYRIKKVLEKKESLENKANERCMKNKPNAEMLVQKVKTKGSDESTIYEANWIEEVDSSELFYEFEALLSDISSFIDYSIKIIKVFYPNVNTKKRKIIKSFRETYPSSKIYKIFKNHFDSWIDELIDYRDHVVHLSSLNSHIKSVAKYNSGYRRITKTSNSINLRVEQPYFTPEVEPIYLPLKPDFRHNIQNQLEYEEINYEDDFYTFEEYFDNLKENFNDFSLSFVNEVSNEILKF